MTIFLESLWIWIGLALFLAVAGGSAYMGTQNRKALIFCSVAAIVSLLFGVVLVYFTETDYKSVSKMLTQLSQAIEEDNLEKVKTFIAPDAVETRIKAESNMARVRLTRARFNNLTVEANHLTTPPTARVKFTAVVHYQFKSGTGIPGISDNRGVVRVLFDVELEKMNKSWVVTDKCDFTPTAT